MSQVLTQTLTQTTCHITNQCGTDLLVLLAANPAGNNLKQLYEQPLSLPGTGLQDAVLKNGALATISLSDKQDGMAYTLIFAQANNLFPVKVAPVVFNSGEASVVSLQVSAQDRADMQLAEKFVQGVTSFPSSGLAGGYAKALSGGNPKTVNDFFQSNPDYKSLTADKVVAVQTYYNTFPYIWANYAEEKTYQLYTTDGTTTTAAGSLTITAPAAAVASIDKSNNGFQFIFRGPGAAARQTLQYAQGSFLSRQGDSPSIALQGLFALKSQLTGKEPDNAVITLVKGTVNGIETMGYGKEQDGEPWISLDGLLHPDSLKDWLQLSGMLAGMAAALLVMAAGVVGVIYTVIRKGGPGYGFDEDAADGDQYAAYAADRDFYKNRTKERLWNESNQEALALADKQAALTIKLADQFNDEGMQEIMDNLSDIQADLHAYSFGSANYKAAFKAITDRLAANAALLNKKAGILEKQNSDENTKNIKQDGETIDYLSKELTEKGDFTRKLEFEDEYDSALFDKYVIIEN